MSTLHNANREWSSRSMDERYGDRRNDLLRDADAMKARCFTGRISDLRTAEIHPDATGNLSLHADGAEARLSNYAFGQMAQIVGAPASYLGTLTPETAARAMNEGIQRIDGELARTALLENAPDGLRIRGLQSDVYQQVWNADTARELFSGLGPEWVAPPAYTVTAPAADKGGWPTFSGEMSPQGLYLGDRSMFIFLVNETQKVDAGDGDLMSQGLMLWNAEIAGCRTVGGMNFRYDYVCGNHFVWGADGVIEWKFRHVGADVGARAMAEIARMLADVGAVDLVAEAEQIKASKGIKIAETREETIEIVRNVTGLTKKATLASLALADAYADAHGANGDYLWGAVSGITRYSQASQWADDRVAVDAAAAKLFVRLAA